MKTRFLHTKIKGSIMGLVLTITMLVTLLSSLFILKSGLDTQTGFMYETNDKLINNVESGLQLLLSDNNLVQPNASTILDLFDEGNDSVLLERNTWGAFEIISAKAFDGKKYIFKSAMIGSRRAYDTIPITLFVADLGKPISVCGNTHLSGKCYVPESGFKRAYIEGQNYTGDKYVYGTSINSERYIPELNKTFVKNLEDFIKQPINPNDSVVSIEDISTKDTIINSFQNKTLALVSQTHIHISNIVLIGNIKLIAPVIKIHGSAQLTNTLLIANTIELEDNVTGEFQAFARQQIITGKKASLMYPSLLCVYQTKPLEDNAIDIYIGEEANIVGDIISIHDKSMTEQEPYISIDKNTQITGNVYVNGKLDIKGKIYGSSYCNRFYLKTNSGIYENHLLNAELDATKLPKHYLGASFLKEGNKKEVLLWL